MEYMIVLIGKGYLTDEGNYCGEGTERNEFKKEKRYDGIAVGAPTFEKY